MICVCCFCASCASAHVHPVLDFRGKYVGKPLFQLVVIAVRLVRLPVICRLWLGSHVKLFSQAELAIPKFHARASPFRLITSPELNANVWPQHTIGLWAPAYLLLLRHRIRCLPRTPWQVILIASLDQPETAELVSQAVQPHLRYMTPLHLPERL